MDAQYTIKAASKRSGLTTHTIRAWERRHGVLSPLRSESNRRLFSLDDVERLTLLRQATEQGHSIGNIAHLSNQELISLGPLQPVPTDWPIMERCSEAVTRLDSHMLLQLFVQQGNEIGVSRAIDEAIIPLLRLSGSRWEEGSWSVAHEHLVTATVRQYVEEIRSRIQPRPLAPKIVVCTLSGQAHEIGALLAALTASMAGWDVAYLGANMPANDIAAAAKSLNADAAAVSISLPLDIPRIESELSVLRSQAGNRLQILIGGPASASLRPTVSEIGAEILADFADLRRRLAHSQPSKS